MSNDSVVAPTPERDRTRDLRINALYEGILTLILLFGVETIVRWVFGPSAISRAVPSLHGKLAIVGGIVAVFLTLLILSPLGRASGGHMNPAISVAMWRYGVLERRVVPYYVLAQLGGSALGVLLGRAVWGSLIEHQPVSYGVLHPAGSLSSEAFFLLEAVTMAAIIVGVGLVLATPRLATAVPFVVGLLVGTAIFSLGTLTGGSDNPARQFGPAIVSGTTGLLWVFLLAPLVGALVAPLIQGVILRRPLTTHALCGPDAQTAQCLSMQPPATSN